MRINRLTCTIATSLLSQAIGLSAQRACGGTTFPWSISEWTYDGPEKGLSGRAGTDSVVGLLLSNGGTTYSCIGTWPEDWNGWDQNGSALIWHSCLNNFGRSVDETLSFAVDWKNRTFHVSHTFKCQGDTSKSQLATGSIPLETTCDTTSPEKPSRCLTTARRIDVTTTQGEAFAASTCNAGGYLPWQVANWAKLYTATPQTSGQLFSVRNTATNEVFSCSNPSPKITQDAQEKVIEGTCVSSTTTSGQSTTSFGFDTERKLLSIRQSGVCAGSVTYRTVGNAEVPPLCWENDVPTCEAESAFWIGARVV